MFIFTYRSLPNFTIMAPVLIHLEIHTLSSQYKPSILLKGQCDSWYWSLMIFMRLVNKLSSGLRGSTVQFNFYVVIIESKMNWWEGCFTVLMTILYRFTEFTSVLLWSSTFLCIKSGDVTLPLKTPDDILWITVIGVCLFCGHLLNHPRHFMNNHAPAFYRARWLAKVTRRV